MIRMNEDRKTLLVYFSNPVYIYTVCVRYGCGMGWGAGCLR